MTMNAIADWLTGSGESDRPILDQTGLNGTFDFTFESDPGSLRRKVIAASNVSIFVVDNVEYPSSN